MNRNLKNILSLPLVLACAFFISSCSKDEVEIERPEKVYYDTAQRRMKVNNYFGERQPVMAFSILIVLDKKR